MLRGARVLFAALATIWAASPLAAAPRRIVSINLCADQYLLALADPAQIAALSPLSDDPRSSYFADRAGAFPKTRGSAEEAVRLGADLVLTGTYDSRYARELLAASQVPALAIAPWTSLDEGRAQIRSIATTLGHPERGEALVAALDGALADAHGAAPAGRAALVLEKRGFVQGPGSLMHEVMAAAGFADAAPQAGIVSYGFVSLERLVTLAPPVIVTGGGDGAQDQGGSFLLHPAVRGMRAARLVAPARLTLCPGPSTPELIATLARQARELPR